MQHSKAAAGFGTSLLDVAKAVENDKDISGPIMKVYVHVNVINTLKNLNKDPLRN